MSVNKHVLKKDFNIRKANGEFNAALDKFVAENGERDSYHIVVKEWGTLVGAGR